ncbi:hypothetical protein E3N88_42941 [Mikania micrantha]|uniref:Reverse transcriptase Ty1/copia-type domain-containing protein n=1 Tax=Mikania micrantha TaxID=192012 RepID=A0A5N6LII8_9ASTR|nr:hypothetical protein E3N88_42941 [Mikania micrantha]
MVPILSEAALQWRQRFKLQRRQWADKSSVIQKDYVEFEYETLDTSGESVTPEVVFDSGSTGVDTDDNSVSGSTGNDSDSNGSGSNGSESSKEKEDSTSVHSSSIPGSPVPQPKTQHSVRRSTKVTARQHHLTSILRLPIFCYYQKTENLIVTLKPYKAKLVVKGFQQKEGVDYNEIFSPVVKMTTIQLVLSIVASENRHLEQLDVKTAFLPGNLDEDIYMMQPEGFHISGKEIMVCKLKKSLYGLKQAPRQLYLKFDNFMDRNGFKRCEMDHCCYIKKFSKSYTILLLYVDDMLIAGSDMKEINKLKKQMSKEFEMKDLGTAKQILGMCIFKNNEDIAGMAKVPYASAVGCLMYAMVCTRPDIVDVVGVVSRYMSNPRKEHWEPVKWLLRYLKGTSKMGLCFKGGTAVSWMSRLQRSVALSTTEAEYMAAAKASKELIWLKNFLEELGKKQPNSPLYCDNQSAIHLGKNLVFHGKTKHIQLRYHFIRGLISDGTLMLEKIGGTENPADMMTKIITAILLKINLFGKGNDLEMNGNVIKDVRETCDLALDHGANPSLSSELGAIAPRQVVKMGQDTTKESNTSTYLTKTESKRKFTLESSLPANSAPITVNGAVSKIRVLNEGDGDDCKGKSRIKVLRSRLLARPPVMLPWLEEGLPLVELSKPNFPSV